MIDRKKLRQLNENDLPLHVLEQDYIQALFIDRLYKETENLVFKGGTFLKHAHGLDRFSEDLDFTMRKSNDIVAAMRTVANNLKRYGVEAEINNIKEYESGLSARLRYEGPLYGGNEKSRGNIDLEISKRDDIFLEPEWTRLFFPYPEVRAVAVLGLRIEEVMAEKLRALSTRSKGRDLYDVWFLLQQDMGIEKDLFEKKMKVIDAGKRVILSVTEDDWKRDLKVLLEHPPPYESVRRKVRRSIEDSGITFIEDCD